MPLANLKLKVGCPIIVIRNLFPKQGICNGTRLVVTKLGKNFILGKILTGSHKGEEVFIPRVILSSGDSDFDFTLLRRQFPVRLVFALSINKSQGQSLAFIGADLRE